MQLDFYSASQLRKRDGSKDKGKVEIGFLTTLWYTKENNIWTRVSRILSSPGVFNGSAAMRSLFHTKKTAYLHHHHLQQSGKPHPPTPTMAVAHCFVMCFFFEQDSHPFCPFLTRYWSNHHLRMVSMKLKLLYVSEVVLHSNHPGWQLENGWKTPGKLNMAI